MDPAKRNRSRIGVLVLAGGIIGLAGLLITLRTAYLGPGWDRTRPVRLGEVVHPGDATKFNLLLVTLDTTRPDYLGCYGDRKARTPVLDGLLEHGVRIDNAVTAVPTTLASHCTILTGLDPYHHGVRNNGTYALPSDRTTLAEVLKGHGYDTAAFLGCFVLDRRFGLDQGFDTYDFAVSDEGRLGPQQLANERSATDVTNAALTWFKRRAQTDTTAPFFAWVHYYDPHAPHHSPLQNNEAFRDRPFGAYASEIAYVDLQLKRVLEMLDRRKLRDRTLIVVVSDHGESLSEHQEGGHGVFLYETTVWAAMLFSSPALFDEAYRIDDRVVGMVDLVPTVTDLLGVPFPVETDGRSLFADADADRAVYLETLYPYENMGCSPLFGLRRRFDKYIQAPKAEYYDLQKDRGELHNLYAPSKPEVVELQRRLRQLRAAAGAGSPEAPAARTMTPEEQKRLASLGYAGAGSPRALGDLPDPKDGLPVILQLKKCSKLRDAQRFEEALQCALEVKEQTAGVELPVYEVAEIYNRMGQPRKAVEVLQKQAHQRPTIEILVRLAEGLYHLGDHAEFEKTLAAAEAVDPLCGAVPVLRGDDLFQQQRYAEAAAQYAKALEIDGQRVNPDVRAKLGLARRRAGKAPAP